jgi:hypothetical protein
MQFPEPSQRLKKLINQGRPWEYDMAVDTVVNAELWLILAAMIGWIVLGRYLTGRHYHQAPRQPSRNWPRRHSRL